MDVVTLVIFFRQRMCKIVDRAMVRGLDNDGGIAIV